MVPYAICKFHSLGLSLVLGEKSDKQYLKKSFFQEWKKI